MGEAKRRKETGTPPPNRKKDRKSLYIGISVIVLVFVAVGVFFLTASPAPTSDELPVAGPNADPFPAQLDRFGVSVGDEDACKFIRNWKMLEYSAQCEPNARTMLSLFTMNRDLHAVAADASYTSITSFLEEAQKSSVPQGWALEFQTNDPDIGHAMFVERYEGEGGEPLFQIYNSWVKS